MTLKKTWQFTMIALAFTIAIGAQAKTKVTTSMFLHHDATIAGSHLASGKYNVQWQTHSPEATVTFLHGNKVVATAEGKVVDRGTKYGFDEVMYDQTADGARVVQEIRFKGSSEIIVFNE
ncbi:MAG TPA: hypothetical protein VKO18_07215 [Terriglobia bacterium]|nr:hypothetical protein [Terriglobia bacterium]